MQSNNPALRNSPFAGQKYADFRTPSADELNRTYYQGYSGGQGPSGGRGTGTQPAPPPPAPQYQPVTPPPAQQTERALTLDDVVIRTVFALAVLVAAATVAWIADSPILYWAFLPGLILGLVIAIKQITNPVAVLAYAGLQGLALGSISLWFESLYPGIVVQAVVGTFVVFAGALTFYRVKRFRMTPQKQKVLMLSLFGVLGLMVFNLIFTLITGEASALRDGGIIAIAFSLLVIGIAAFTLLADFDMIETGIEQGVPARFGWYAVFGLMVTLIWLYLEILRLLSYFRE